MTTLRTALTGLALLLSSAAGAADLRGSVALPPAPELPALYDWSGFYVGLQGGYGWGSNRVRIGGATGPFAPMSFRIDDNLGFGGVHAGLNYQMGSIVLGVEGDVEVLQGSGRFTAGGLNGRITQDWQGALRARIGYAFDRLMIYGTGGASFTEYERRVYDGAGLSERLTAARTGWNIGAGVNFALTESVILGAEYRYTDFGRNRFTSSGAFTGLTGSQELATQSARASIAYKF
ncbi:outer membrane protein [Bosea sp. BH3]|uniref:outer membrane protein n=1 Tax=Bosea sp. BH3 TaxID=2871701 RepID=UPI0021CB175C|nr:outer membrane protein [Bosea sp. BH3]MCU4181302.1 porin family protein [Bosea sp. BH3]